MKYIDSYKIFEAKKEVFDERGNRRSKSSIVSEIIKKIK